MVGPEKPLPASSLRLITGSGLSDCRSRKGRILLLEGDNLPDHMVQLICFGRNRANIWEEISGGVGLALGRGGVQGGQRQCVY